MINKLLGYDKQSTGEIRQKDGRGRHTTTRREMLLLPNGGVVIDTPECAKWELSAPTFQSRFPTLMN